MRNSPPSWVDPLMRVGYTARGLVYVLVGALAFTAAVGTGRTPDSKSALATLLDENFGAVMVGMIALGLVAYASWKFLDSTMDLDDKGTVAKGWIARAAQFISGAIHLTLGISVALLALGRGSGGEGGGDSRVEEWTAVLMEQPFGRWLVAIVGCVAFAVGVQHFVRAYKEKYKDDMRYTQASERLDPVLKLGLAAHGLVVALVGTFFVWAAWTANPSEAGGMREALLTLRQAEGGKILLATVALGLLAFAVYCFIEAIYRIVPRCAPMGVQTLASRTREVINDSASMLRS